MGATTTASWLRQSDTNTIYQPFINTDLVNFGLSAGCAEISATGTLTTTGSGCHSDTLQGVTENGATTTIFSAFTSGIAVDTDSLYVSGSLNNVGISTTTPSSRLTIVNTSTDNSLCIYDTTSDTTPTCSDANGNLGLGVEVPSYKLDIQDASGLDGATPVTTNIYSTSNGTWTDEAIPAQLLFGTADTTGGSGTRGAIKLFADDTSGADNGLSFWTTSSGSGGVTEKLRINHTGNVAIGTTVTNTATTEHKFSVVGTGIQLYASDVLTSSTTKNFRIGMPHYDNVTNTRPFIGWYMTGDNGSNNVYMGGGTSAGYAATQIRLITAADTTTTAGSTRFIVASDGKISAGNTTAQGALTVGENRSFAGMTTSLSGRVFGTEAITITDTDQSGTIANRNAVAFRTPTFASTNSVTLTESASVYISSAPTAGTNTTITNPYAFWVDAGRTRLDGGVRLSTPRAVTATTTADVNTDFIINATSGTFDVDLPTAVGNGGTVFIIMNSGTGAVTVDPNSTETINGASTYPLNVQYSVVTIVSNGSNWLILNEK